MRSLCLALVLATLSGGAGTSTMAAAQAAPPGLTLKQLLSAPDSYLDRPIEVVIVEPLAGPATAKALASLEYGQVRIRVPDGGGIVHGGMYEAHERGAPAQ